MHANLDRLQLADPAVTHQFAGEPKFLGRPLLGAELKYTPVPVHFFPQHLDLVDAHAEGLLNIEVFARPHRSQSVQHVPGVQGSDANGVNVAARQKLAEILVRGADLFVVFSVDDMLCLLPPPTVRIAYRHRLDIRLGR